MGGEDIFWKLENPISIDRQEKFYELLGESDDIRDIIYRPSKLSQKKFSSRRRIEHKVFTRVSFSKTTIRNIIFRDCVFTWCQFIGSRIIDCEFHNCRFIMTNTHKVSISDTYIDPKSFTKCLDQRKHQNIGIHLFHVLLKNSRDEDQKEFERFAQFMFLRWKRYEDHYKILRTPRANWFRIQFANLCVRWFLLILWEWLFGSGVRLTNFILTTAMATLIFSAINCYFQDEFGLLRGDLPMDNYVDSLYFTIISLTTLGYGDFVPTTLYGRLFASFQSIVGFCLFALLASMFYRRITR